MCNFSSYTTNANCYGEDLILQKLADLLPPKCNNTHFASEQSCLRMESTYTITRGTVTSSVLLHQKKGVGRQRHSNSIQLLSLYLRTIIESKLSSRVWFVDCSKAPSKAVGYTDLGDPWVCPKTSRRKEGNVATGQAVPEKKPDPSHTNIL